MTGDQEIYIDEFMKVKAERDHLALELQNAYTFINALNFTFRTLQTAADEFKANYERLK